MKILFLLLALGLQQVGMSPVIESVQVRGNRRTHSDAIRFHVQSKPGDAFNVNRASQDVVAIRQGVPGLSDVRVEQEPGAAGGINLVFYIAEAPVIRSVTFLGLSSTQESDLVKMLTDRKAVLAASTPYNETSARQTADAIKSWLMERGRPSPDVQIETQPIPPNSVVVTFRIRE
jgi:outer membrane protein assembly factor BamA